MYLSLYVSVYITLKIRNSKNVIALYLSLFLSVYYVENSQFENVFRRSSIRTSYSRLYLASKKCFISMGNEKS